MAIIKKSINNLCWRGYGKKGTLLYCWWSEVKVAQSCLTLCDPMDCPWNSPGQNSSQPRDPTQVSRIAGRFFTRWAIRDVINLGNGLPGTTWRKLILYHVSKLFWTKIHSYQVINHGAVVTILLFPLQALCFCANNDLSIYSIWWCRDHALTETCIFVSESFLLLSVHSPKPKKPTS